MSLETSGRLPTVPPIRGPKAEGSLGINAQTAIFLLLGKPLEQSDDLIFKNLFYKKKKKKCSAVRASKEVSVLFSFVFWVFMQLLHFPVEYCFTITTSSLFRLSSFLALLKEPWNVPFL